MKYRPEIDGLRAIAVMPVVLFHAGFTTFSGGFVGVDVFFVISGYLITTIILSEMAQGSFSLINFYERRARRILPAVFLVMLISLLFAWLFLMPSDMKLFCKSLVAVSSFSSNILFWSEAGYWDIANEIKPLLHTWSLAVEEQYYVLFPLFLMLMWRYRKRWIFGILILFAGISLAAAQWGAHHMPSATFYLLPTRVWELAIGACIAFYFFLGIPVIGSLLAHKFVAEIFGLIGLLMIGYATFIFDEKTPFPSLYALVPTIGAGLIITFSSSQTIVGRLLGTRPIVAIGLISYSAYLWHQPLFAFVRYMSFSEPKYSVFLGLIIFTLLLSYLSWRFVEKPFRNKRRYGRKKIFILSLAGSLAASGVGLAGIYFDGFNQRSMYTNLFVNNYQPDNIVLGKQSWTLLRKLSNDDKYGVSNNEYDQELWFTKDDGRQKLLLVGNSHSKDIYNIFTHSDYVNANFQIARYGTQISDLTENTCKLFSSPNYKQSDIVVLVSRYTSKDSAELEEVVKKFIKDHKKIVLVKNIFEFENFSNKTIADNLLQKKYLGKFIKGEATAAMIVNDINTAYYTNFITKGKNQTIKQSDIAIEAVANKYDEILVLDRMEYICNKKVSRCSSMNIQFDKYFYDYGHHTLEGAMFFGHQVDQGGWLGELGRASFKETSNVP